MPLIKTYDLTMMACCLVDDDGLRCNAGGCLPQQHLCSMEVGCFGSDGYAPDSDGDGIGNNSRGASWTSMTMQARNGLDDVLDVFPLDGSAETIDTDGDGVGNNGCGSRR